MGFLAMVGVILLECCALDLRYLNRLLCWDKVLLQIAAYFLVLLLLSFGIDILWYHPMCELCVLQRLWMVGIMAVAVFYYHKNRFSDYGLWLVGAMLWLGLAAAIYQLVLYKVHMLSSACHLGFGPQYLPVSVYAFLSRYYRFAPCEAAVYSFMGLSFIWWNVIAYCAILLRYIHGVLYERVID